MRSIWNFSHANTNRNFSSRAGLHRVETTPGGHSAITYKGFAARWLVRQCLPARLKPPVELLHLHRSKTGVFDERGTNWPQRFQEMERQGDWRPGIRHIAVRHPLAGATGPAEPAGSAESARDCTCQPAPNSARPSDAAAAGSAGTAGAAAAGSIRAATESAVAGPATRPASGAATSATRSVRSFTASSHSAI